MKTKKLVQLSLLTAIALSIFIVELQIPNPLPLPGIKLGLANIVTLYVIYRYRAKEALLVLMARIILGSVFSGNLMAIMYSLAGGICCFVVMSVLHDKIEEKYIFIVSILGACAHNIGQIIWVRIIQPKYPFESHSFIRLIGFVILVFEMNAFGPSNTSFPFANCYFLNSNSSLPGHKQVFLRISSQPLASLPL